MAEFYFDDFTVEHIKSHVMQSDDYYPFGLAFNSYQRENTTKNRFKFQGQEHIDDLDLGWDSFKWRNHMPDIGRFFNVDPLASEYVHNSPYAFSENKVTNHIELEGLEAVKADVLLKQKVDQAGRAVMNVVNNVTDAVSDAVDAVGDFFSFSDDLPRETRTPEPIDGNTVYVEGDDAGDPNNLPMPGKDADTHGINKDFIEAVLAGGQTKKVSNAGEFGEKFERTAEATSTAADGVKAGQDAAKERKSKGQTRELIFYHVNENGDTIHKSYLVKENKEKKDDDEQ